MELPDDACKRLQNDYGLSEYLANVLTTDPPAIQMFDKAVSEAGSQLGEEYANRIPENVANLLCNELFALVREHETVKAAEESEAGEASVKFSKVDAKQLGGIAALLVDETISSTMAKNLLRILYTEEQGREPRVIAEERGFQLITDANELDKICREVIDENPEEMEKYRMGGKFARKITKFLLGKSMQKSSMNAHPERLNEVLTEVLDELEPDVEK